MKSSKFSTAVCAFAVALTSLVWAPAVFANEFARVTDFAQLGPSARAREYVFVPGAVVAFANYERIRADWPETRKMDEAAIDSFLIQRFSYISKLQLSLRHIRTDNFHADLDQTRTFLQPIGWNRAAVEGEAGASLADVKGSGQGNQLSVEKQIRDYETIINSNDLSETERNSKLDSLRTRDHSDGLMTLGEALAETTRQMAVQRLFNRRNAAEHTAYQSVETYFVLSLPVEILKENGKTETAALYGRQAHLGRGQGLELPPGMYIDDFGGMQMTSFGSAVDFGGVQISAKEFEPTFGSPISDPQSSKAWAYAHETAKAFTTKLRAGDSAGARDAVRAHIETMLSPVPDVGETQTAELDYFRDRLKSAVAGPYAARFLLHHDLDATLKNTSRSTSAQGLVNLFKAAVSMKIPRENLDRLATQVGEAIFDSPPHEATSLVVEALSIPQDHLRLILSKFLISTPRNLLASALKTGFRDRAAAHAVTSELLSLTAVRSPISEDALSVLTSSGFFEIKWSRLARPFDRDLIESLQRSPYRAARDWARDRSNRAQSPSCRDLFR